MPGFNLNTVVSLSGNGRVIVGQSSSFGLGQPDTRPAEAFRWSTDSGMELLGLPEGYLSSRANAVSGNGEVIIGSSRGPSGTEGWLWTEGVGFDYLPKDLGIPWGISADGDVVFGSKLRWTADQGILSTGVELSSFMTRPVSADGTAVAGQIGSRAVRWTESAGVQDLGVLPSYPNHAHRQVHAISADGVVVLGGSYNRGEGGGLPTDQHAFVWDEVHGMRDLETVLRDEYGLTDLHPWGLSSARDISADRRTITGSAKPGRDNGGDEETWVVYLDKPIGPPLPEFGDYNADAKVGQSDLNLVLGKWGQAASIAAYPWINDLPTGSIDQNELDAVVLNWPTSAGSLNLTLGLSNGALTANYDLKTNAAIVDYDAASPTVAVRQQILAGRGGPGLGKTWNGQGITSSTAATANGAEADSRSVGYAENSALPLGAYTTFRGQPVDESSILIAFTRTGDANLDGIVNDDDVTIVGATYAPGLPQPSWTLGDFDYNGFIDDDDVTLLGAFYDPNAAPLAPPSDMSTVNAVPEPNTLVSTAFAALLLAVFVVRRNREVTALRT